MSDEPTDPPSNVTPITSAKPRFKPQPMVFVPEWQISWELKDFKREAFKGDAFVTMRSFQVPWKIALQRCQNKCEPRASQKLALACAITGGLNYLEESPAIARVVETRQRLYDALPDSDFSSLAEAAWLDTYPVDIPNYHGAERKQLTATLPPHTKMRLEELSERLALSLDKTATIAVLTVLKEQNEAVYRDEMSKALDAVTLQLEKRRAQTELYLRHLTRQ